MIVPQYWAEARLQERARGKQVTVRRFGWSDQSQEQAQAHAEIRVREALDRVLAGEKLPRREAKRAYNGAEGLPIREEVIARHGESVITRNSYGALCLNSPNAMFIDIDFHDRGPATRLKRWIRTPLIIAAVAIGLIIQSWVAGLISVVVALMVAASTSGLVHRFQSHKQGGLEGRADKAIDAFVASHPDWRLRQYRTPGGFRLLAMHRTFDPREPEVQACFRALQADPVYALMCVRQHCFRARLTPKPWRIGIVQHMRPSPGVWPIRPERLAERRRWVADYERLSTNYAACSYRRTLGEGGVDPAVEQVPQLHDRMAQAEHALPMA